jgi:uncharacterized membrane protein
MTGEAAMTHEGEQEIDGYVRRLLWALQTLPHDDRLNIAGEIHSHLSECAGRGPRDLDRAIAGLGSPDALARSYVEEFELAGAVNSASPVTLLLTVLNRATRSVMAFLGGFAALTLYLLAVGCAMVAVGKFIVPGKVGAWISDHSLTAGIVDTPPAGGHELLGYWIVPIAAAIAALCFVGAGKLLRLIGRRLLARVKPRAGRQG